MLSTGLIISVALLLLSCLVLYAAASASAHTIDTIVYVMFENRPHGQIFGWRNNSDGFINPDGSVVKFCNDIVFGDKSKGEICATTGQSDRNPCDPDHSTPATTAKIWGPVAAASHNLTHTPSMGGFVNFERLRHGDRKAAELDYCSVLKGFARNATETAPWNALADSFVIGSQFSASIPGPTFCNRLMATSATSMGLTETVPWYGNRSAGNVRGALFPQTSIFGQLTEANKSWAVAANDTVWEIWLADIARNPDRIYPTTEFFKQARGEGGRTLPNFVYINPRVGCTPDGVCGQDMHPDNSVALASTFLKDIYESLRAGPSWNNTLLIVTFDEHGGFADKLPTQTPNPAPGQPGSAPPPDAVSEHGSWPDNFRFDRTGIRIPLLLVSPWLPANQVLGAPAPVHQPTPTSVYEHTSLLKLIRTLLGIEHAVGPLTKRDEWAANMSHIFDLLSGPRTDCPMHLPMPSVTHHHSLPRTVRDHERPLNSLQMDLAEIYGVLGGMIDGEQHHDIADVVPIQKMHEFGPFVQRAFDVHKRMTERWRHSLDPAHHHHLLNRRAWRTSAALRPLHALLRSHHSSSPAAVSAASFSTAAPKFVLRCEPRGSGEHFINATWSIPFIKSAAATGSYTTISTSTALTELDDAPRFNHQKGSQWCWAASTLAVGAEVTVSLCSPSADPRVNRDPAQQWLWRDDQTFRPVGNPGLCVQHGCLKQGSSDSTVPMSSALTLQPCDPLQELQRLSFEGDKKRRGLDFGDYDSMSIVLTLVTS